MHQIAEHHEAIDPAGNVLRQAPAEHQVFQRGHGVLFQQHTLGRHDLAEGTRHHPRFRTERRGRGPAAGQDDVVEAFAFDQRPDRFHVRRQTTIEVIPADDSDPSHRADGCAIHAS